MMIEHLAIDGSVVRIDADGDLSSGVTATGWVLVPSLLQTHPFTVTPAGHSRTVEEDVRSNFPQVEFLGEEELSVRGGTLRTAVVKVPTATGQQRVLTVGYWEGERGCLATSLVGESVERLAEVFETVEVSETSQGLRVDSPVAATPRAPEVIQHVPELGILSIRPAVAEVLGGIPRSRGATTSHGEVFRTRASERALVYVSPSAVTHVNPGESVDPREMLAVVESLRVEWVPRGDALH